MCLDAGAWLSGSPVARSSAARDKVQTRGLTGDDVLGRVPGWGECGRLAVLRALCSSPPKSQVLYARHGDD